MAKVELLRTGVAEDVAKKVEELRGYVNRYDWGDWEIHLYGYPVKVSKFLDGFEDFARYTSSSRDIMRSEMNGFIKIINKWIEREEEPKAIVRYLEGKKKGKIETIPNSFAQDLYEIGFVEVIATESK